NVSSEVIGICLYDAIKRFGERKVAEFDSTAKKSEEVVSEIVSVFNGEVKSSISKVDWLSLVVKNNDLQRFFKYP
ncbi:MAG: shikimate kinase, partial [Nitrososphaerales archaeon]